MASTALGQVEAKMKDIINNLYVLMVQTVDHAGEATEGAMKTQIKQLISDLIALSKAAPHVKAEMPKEIVDYVQQGRNPEIYTREFVEAVMRMNQQLKGKSEAFADFRDVFAREWAGMQPEMRNEIRQVVESTGGSLQS